MVLDRYSDKLDELLILRDNSQRLLGALQQRYRDETGTSRVCLRSRADRQPGVGSLKIRENGLIGHFVEVPQGQAGRLPAAKFTNVQTVSGAARFKSTVRRCSGASTRALTPVCARRS
jgi:DNA mismatch repair protein MutS